MITFTTKKPLSFEEIRARVLAKKSFDLLVREARQEFHIGGSI